MLRHCKEISISFGFISGPFELLDIDLPTTGRLTRHVHCLNAAKIISIKIYDLSGSTTITLQSASRHCQVRFDDFPQTNIKSTTRIFSFRFFFFLEKQYHGRYLNYAHLSLKNNKSTQNRPIEAETRKKRAQESEWNPVILAVWLRLVKSLSTPFRMRPLDRQNGQLLDLQNSNVVCLQLMICPMIASRNHAKNVIF